MKILILSFSLLIGIFTANLVQAGFVTDPIVPCTNDCKLCDIWHLVSNIINFISFNLAIPAAVLLFIAAGVMFLISGGNQEKVASARGIFTNTVIGLVIIFCSWMLIDTLIKTIATSGTTDAWDVAYFWNEFPDCP